jgi:hypothetical protein
MKGGAVFSGMTENVRLANSEERALDQVWVKGAPYPHQGSCPVHITIIPRASKEVKKKTIKIILLLFYAKSDNNLKYL